MFDDARFGSLVRPLEVDVVGDIGNMLWILLGTVGLVLLVACANVANLFLVRAEARQQELAIRLALGAEARRVAWELMSESLLVALARRRRSASALAYGGIQLLALPAAGAVAAAERDRARSARAVVHAGDLDRRRSAVRRDPDPEVRAAAHGGGAEGQLARLERRPRAPSRAQYAGGRAGRARRRAARRLGPDGAHVPRDSRRAAWVPESGERPDHAHLDSARRWSPIRDQVARHARGDRRIASRPSPASSRSACPRRSRWTATATTIRSGSKTSRRPTPRFRRCAG